MIKQTLICLITIASITTNYGQVSTTSLVDTSFLIDDVVIAQNRLSAPLSENARNIQIINREEINALPATNIPELLQYMGAVDIRRRGVNGVQSDVGLRGSTFNQVLVLVNGVRMSDPQTGHHMMNLPVALEDVERIEVIKGPAARIYGMNAMAGAINIITKVQEGEEFTMTAGASISAFETYGMNISASLNSKVIDQTLSISRQGSEGYRYNTDYNINTAFYQANIHTGSLMPLSVQAGFTEREFGANGFYANEAFVDQYEEVRTGFVSATTTFISGDLVFKPRASWRTNKDEYVFLRQNPSFFMNEHRSNSYIGELHASYTSKAGVTGFGVDYAKETLVSNNLGTRERNVLGLFLEHRIKFLDDKLGITAGVYGNKVSDYDFKAYPGIDAYYKITPKFNLFATANWSDRIPTYTNLYYSSRTEQGNENLVAESATAYEVGAKYNRSDLNITVSAFLRNNSNLIDWYKDSTAQEKWQIRNFNEVNVAGVDLNMSVDLAHHMKIDHNVRANINYTYINAKVVDNSEIAVSRYALDNLSQQLLIGLQFDILKDKVNLNTNYRYLDRVSLTDYSLVDMKLNYTGSNFAAYISANNLMDAEYRETNLVPMPGRWFGVGVRFF
ncbi:MAG: iron complex outermembrane receptor protein [Halioglobus sp.]|jgi:iron complex outermembrane receptor protein